MIIGRKEEQKILLSARETFGYKFTFQHTGLAKGSTKDQLFSFAISLRDAGYDDCPGL